MNRAIPLGHCTEDYEKRFPVYDKRLLEKAQTSIKKLIVQVKKNGNSIDLRDFCLRKSRFFFRDVRYWFHVSAQKLSVVMCNGNESAVLCLEEEREFSLCMRLWTHDHSVAFRICLRKKNPSSLVSFKTLRYSRNKENRKGKPVTKNDTFYVSLRSPVISTFFCSFVLFIRPSKHKILFLYRTEPNKNIYLS